MEENIILYGEITLAGFENLEIKKLTVTQEVNEHAHLNLYARLAKEDEQNYIEAFNLNKALKFIKDGKTLFVGLMRNFQVITVQNVQHVNIDVISLTYLMDIDLRCRSFQNTDMSYDDVLEEVTDIKVYSKSIFTDNVSKGKKINKPIIQYMETDWQFLKRLATHFNSVLIPNVRLDGPAFFFGIPSFGSDNLKLHNFTSISNFERYRVLSTETPLIPFECKSFETEVYKLYELGEKVIVNNITTHVGKTTYSYENSFIRNICVFNIPAGLSTIFAPNLNIAGSSIFGRVLAVARDRVKIHLDIDKDQPIDEAFWYPYATMYASNDETGWYCMPEIDDVVRLYHPDGIEESAMLINSIKPHPTSTVENLPANHRMANPDIKYFRTAFGKELKLRPDGIDIIAKDNTVFITLNDDGTMYFNSNDKISMTAVNDIEIKAKNVNIEAEEKIELKSKDGTLEMLEDIVVKGKEVRTN